MLTLVFTLCMVADPAQCETRHKDLFGVNELTCQAQAQAEVARETLPGWRPVRYGCRRIG